MPISLLKRAYIRLEHFPIKNSLLLKVKLPFKPTRDSFCFLGIQNFPGKPPPPPPPPTQQADVLNFQSNIAQSTQRLFKSEVFKSGSENTMCGAARRVLIP